MFFAFLQAFDCSFSWARVWCAEQLNCQTHISKHQLVTHKQLSAVTLFYVFLDSSFISSYFTFSTSSHILSVDSHQDIIWYSFSAGSIEPRDQVWESHLYHCQSAIALCRTQYKRLEGNYIPFPFSVWRQSLENPGTSKAARVGERVTASQCLAWSLRCSSTHSPW